ncbi:MAG: hypothetical protein J6W09_11330 [Bacteroidales bacterium]|nr:hypothetical protein [Bacteroidales bacterium]
MEHEMHIAEWSRVIGTLFWKRLAEQRPYDGYDKYELAGKLIDTIKLWYPEVINIPSEKELGFAFTSDQDQDAFYEARNLFVIEWSSALEEMETMATSGEMTWDEVWDELRICKNSGRPMEEGFMYNLEYYGTMADLLMEVSWKDYLEAYANGESDSTMYTQWEGYLRY